MSGRIDQSGDEGRKGPKEAKRTNGTKMKRKGAECFAGFIKAADERGDAAQPRQSGRWPSSMFHPAIYHSHAAIVPYTGKDKKPTVVF